MQADELAFVAALVHARAGIVLGSDKAYLIESRLASVASRFGFARPGELSAALRRAPDEALARAVIEAMTTNETSFFRDARPFEELQHRVLPQLVAARADRRTLRIWSAAASTGQEAYSIAMCLDELSPPLDDWRITIIGTDIALTAIERARVGRYSAFEIRRGLTDERLQRHFSPVGNEWQVGAHLARMVDFRCANLLAGCRGLGRFDIVFLRNVLIYFDLETRRRVLAEIRAMLADDGYLFLGGAETVLGLSDAFAPWPKARGIVRPIDVTNQAGAPAAPAASKSIAAGKPPLPGAGGSAGRAAGPGCG